MKSRPFDGVKGTDSVDAVQDFRQPLYMITVKINGEEQQTAANNLAELLQQLNLQERRCATMVNGTIVKRTARADHPLQPGDDIEIIAMVGGG